MGKEVTGHWKKLVSDPKFLGEADFKDGEEIAVTVESTTEEVVKNSEGSSKKIVLNFKENIKPLILNVTNSKTIAKLTGKRYVQDWKDARLLLYLDPKVRAFGEIVSGVRVRPYPPKATGKTPIKEVKCVCCGANIKPYGEMSTEQMADYTYKKYGKSMCSDCAMKISKGDE